MLRVMERCSARDGRTPKTSGLKARNIEAGLERATRAEAQEKHFKNPHHFRAKRGEQREYFHDLRNIRSCHTFNFPHLHWQWRFTISLINKTGTAQNQKV